MTGVGFDYPKGSFHKLYWGCLGPGTYRLGKKYVVDSKKGIFKKMI